MAKELQQMAEKLHKVELRNQELQRDADESRGTIRAQENELHRMRLQSDATARELVSSKRHYRELEESNRRQLEQLQVIKEEHRRAEAQHAQTCQLLEERTTELRGAQKFLTQTDVLSGAEVIAMAESLNAEILQAAAYMADSLEFSCRQNFTEEDMRVISESHKRSSRVLGEPMMEVFRSRWEQQETDPDPTAVQIALQISMAYCSMKIAELWTHQGNELLADIFSRIYEKGICQKVGWLPVL